jgi:DNA-binding GntR family transcriptional regulator
MTAIYSASRAGDAERARAAAVKHVRNACEVAREAFNSLSPRT